MSASAGPSRQPNLPAKPSDPTRIVRSHHAHTSIRAQTAKQKQQGQGLGQQKGTSGGGGKQGQTNKQQQQQQQQHGGGRGGAEADPRGNKDITKVVLANPLMPSWPNVAPEHQSAILNHLCGSLPDVQAYHISRDRCNRKRKERDRKSALRVAKADEGLGDGDADGGEGGALDGERETKSPEKGTGMSLDEAEPGPITSLDQSYNQTDPDGSSSSNDRSQRKRSADQALLKSRSETSTKNSRPNPSLASALPQSTREPPPIPPILEHLVIGINEVMKHMEKQMGALREGFNAGLAKGEGVDQSAIDVEEDQAGGVPTLWTGISAHSSAQRSPIRIIFVCLPDINPPHLVSPIPQYCTSYNSLVLSCRTKLQRLIRGKTKEELKGRRDVEEMSKVLRGALEVLVVPLGVGAEFELAKVMGLRRVAVMALTSTFPNLADMLHLLRTASILPLRPPFPLHPSSSQPSTPYTPLHLKVLNTTAPSDPKARKAQRLTETREARKRATEGRKNLNEERKRKGVWVRFGKEVGLGVKRGKDRARPPVLNDVEKEGEGAAGTAQKERVAGIDVQM